VLIASSGIIAWIIVKKWTRYEFGLGQGILGMKSGKRSILQKMLNLHFIMILARHPFSAFAPENTPLLRENQYNYIRFDSLNPPFHYPRTPGPDRNYSFFMMEFLWLKYFKQIGSFQTCRTRAGHDSTIPEFQHSNWGEAPNLGILTK